MPDRGAEEYLALAQHAEKAAHLAESENAKRSFRAIAEEYRMLAAEKLEQLRAVRLEGKRFSQTD